MLPVRRAFGRFQSRSIVFVKGERVKGALRDPEEVLSVDGHRHEVSPANLQHIKTYLSQLEDGKFMIPEKLMLQVLTHKSFAGGITAYNEKLSFLGFQFLKHYSSVYSISRPTSSPYSISKLNFDCLGAITPRLILSESGLATFARLSGLSKIIFWRKRDPLIIDHVQSGEELVLSKVVSALIGAINLTHGSRVAEEFIDKELLQNSRFSLVQHAVERSKN